MMRLRRLIFAAFALTCLSALAAPPAASLEQGDFGTIGPSNTHLELTGTPLAGVYPNQGGGADPFAAFRPPTCRTVTYCDAAQFEVKYPKSYLRDVFFGITIELTWDNPRTKSNSETGNDVDLFVWGDDGPAAGGPLSKCGSPTDPAEPPPGEKDDTARCNFIHPEIVSISEPPDTTVEDAPVLAIFLTIVNHTGVNTGYHINVDWFTFDLPPPPAFEQPEREISGQASPTVSGPFNFDVSEVAPGNPTPEPTPRKILVPGPDGKLHEVELPIYAAGNRLGSTADRNEALPWIIAGIVGAVALAAMIFYLARKNRQAMEGW
jgi:hypothetical protein